MQVFNKFKSLLQKNPQVLEKYVATGLAAVKLSLIPITGFMKHLILVQDLDPNTEPGVKARMELFEGLQQHFNKLDTEDYDSDYDFSWFHKKFQETNNSLNGVSFTEDKYYELTDLSSKTDHIKSLAKKIKSKEDPVLEVTSYTEPKKVTKSKKSSKLSKKTVNKKTRKKGK